MLCRPWLWPQPVLSISEITVCAASATLCYVPLDALACRSPFNEAAFLSAVSLALPTRQCRFCPLPVGGAFQDCLSAWSVQCGCMRRYGLKWQQALKACMNRELKLVYRDRFNLYSRTFQIAYLAFLSATLFIKPGNNTVAQGQLFLLEIFFAALVSIFAGFGKVKNTPPVRAPRLLQNSGNHQLNRHCYSVLSCSCCRAFADRSWAVVVGQLVQVK